MTALPSVMAARKAKLIATLPAMDQPQPVVARGDAPKPPDKPAEEPVKLDVNNFAVDPSEESNKEKDEGATDTGNKVTVEVHKKEDDSGDENENTWKWRYKSLEGNHKQILQENREMRDEIVKLTTRLDSLEKAPAAPVKPAEVPIELTDEEMQEYGGALPVLKKLLAQQQRHIEESVVKPLQQEIVGLKKNTDDVAKRTAASDEGTFVQQVRMQVKSIGGDFDATLKNPEWVEFTSRPVSAYTDETIGQALMNAHKKRDLTKVVQVFEDFGKSKTKKTTAFNAPSVSAASGALPNSDKKPILKISKRKEASEKFRKRQISNAEYQAIAQLYREAEAEGRIDYKQ